MSLQSLLGNENFIRCLLGKDYPLLSRQNTIGFFIKLSLNPKFVNKKRNSTTIIFSQQTISGKLLLILI